MTEGSKTLADLLETAPELHKDLLHKGDDGRIWLPATITIPEKGMVFLDGTNTEDWKWAAVKAIPLNEGDKKVTEDQTHRMDMENAKAFERKDFMDALEYIDFYKVDA